jgi:hypothetical protein
MIDALMRRFAKLLVMSACAVVAADTGDAIPRRRFLSHMDRDADILFRYSSRIPQYFDQPEGSAGPEHASALSATATTPKACGPVQRTRGARLTDYLCSMSSPKSSTAAHNLQILYP